MRQAFRLIGISDETVCECCGKRNLKRTVVLERLDQDGNGMEFVKFGRDCAARALDMRVTANRMEAIAVAATLAAEKKAREFVHQVGDTRSVINWIVEGIGENGGKTTFLALANGSKPMVETWAELRFPEFKHNIVVNRPF